MKHQTSAMRSSLGSLVEIFSFFFAQGKRTRRTRVFLVFSFFPALVAAIEVIEKVLTDRSFSDGMNIYSNFILVFYLQFFILLLALFFGTSICSEELEGKTLTYLTTRPVPKWTLVLGKYAAYSLLTILMTVSGVVLAFLILNVNGLLDPSIYPSLLRDLAVLILGLLCYTALFTLIGVFMKKGAIIFGLVFSFGWENVIQYFPGSTQRLAVVHYLKSLLPSSTGGRFTVLLFRLNPTSPAQAVFILLGLTGLFLGLACLFFSRKEYILED